MREARQSTEGGRIARTSADGGTRWVTRLVGEVGRVRPPHVAADAERAYVIHEGGVTVLPRRNASSFAAYWPAASMRT